MMLFDTWFFFFALDQQREVFPISFRVLKTINNNVVSCQDEKGCEYIVMGKGLGFGVKAGCIIPSGQAEKVFRIADQGNMERIQSLFSSLPQDQVEFCAELIQYACGFLGRQLSESIYYTLSDHICFAIRRLHEGMAFPNALHTEVRLFYPKEYAVGCYALSEIAHRFQVQLPEDEAASIALHLLNAEYETSLGIAVQVTQMLSQMLHILEHNPVFQLNRDSLYFDELIVHLKFLALDQFSRNPIPSGSSHFANLIAQEFPQDYQLAKLVVQPLEEASSLTLTPEQLAYLTVNLHRVHSTHF